MNNRWRRVDRLKILEARSIDANSHDLSLRRTKKIIKEMAKAADEIYMSQDSAEKLGEALRAQAEARDRIQREEGTFGHQIRRLKVVLKGFLPTAIKKYFR